MRFASLILLFTFSVQSLSAFAEDSSSGSGEILPLTETGFTIPLSETGGIISDSESGSIAEDSTATGSILPLPVHSPLTVRINEVMWMGSDLGTSDEWIEITAVPLLTGSVVTSPLSLNGWTVRTVKAGTETVIATFGAGHAISSGSYLIVSNFSASASRLRKEPILISSAISLPNTQLLLRLRDASGALIDEVDDGIGAPFAGANPSGGIKASMERIDVRSSGMLKANWRTADTGRGWDSNAQVRGTPGYPNGTIEPPDMMPPPPAMNARAFTISGGTLALWDSVLADDLESQIVTAHRSQGEHLLIILPSSATGVFLSGSGEGITSLEHESIDASGNKSDKSLISVQPLMKPIISEVLPDMAGVDDQEWIELHNPLDTPLDLSGWRLKAGSKTFVFPRGSGSVLSAGEYRHLTAIQTGLSLTNGGAAVELFVLGKPVDRLAYGQSIEGISFYRSEDGAVSFSCSPTPGTSGTGPIGVAITGLVSEGSDPLTPNLQATASGGSLEGASCHWDFGDGYTYSGCNPPAHRMRVGGDLTVSVQATNQCGNTMIQSSTVRVLQKPKSKEEIVNVNKCMPSAFSGVTISEFMPAPTVADREWIELRSISPTPIRMCGWSIDDRAGGSKPYQLGDRVLGPDEYLTLPRDETGIALNNDQDSVRLIAPLPEGGTGVLMSVPYHAAKHDQAYAVRDDGQWLWTGYPSPGDKNRFKEVDLSLGASPVIISAAMPNPDGNDEGNEWIELQNMTMRPQWMNGWVIQTQSGKTLALDGTVLARKETVRIDLKTSFTLRNSDEKLLLLDPDGHIRSVLGWGKTVSDVPIEAPHYESIQIEDVVLIDGMTFRGREERDEEEERAPVFRFGLPHIAIHSDKLFESENLISALIKNKKVELQNSSISEHRYVLADGEDIATVLLEAGLAYVPGGISFSKFMEYSAYEDEARKNMRGIWSSPETIGEMNDRKRMQAEDAVALRDGVVMEVDRPSGVIESGTLIQVRTNVPVEMFYARGSGVFIPFDGGVVAKDGLYSFYADYRFQISGTDTIRSNVVTREYLLKRAYYPRCISISEVYPSPQKGEQEWVELYNKCDQEISLLGWSIDDVPDAGSKPNLIGTGAVMRSQGYLLLSGSNLKIFLNNGGDEVVLKAPDGSIQDSVTYPSIKKGLSYALKGDEFCITAGVTPLKTNTCIAPAKKSAKKVSKSSKKLKIGLKTTYQAFIDSFNESESENTNFSLYSGLTANSSIQNVYNKRVPLTVPIGLFLIGIISLEEWFRLRRSK